MNRTRCILVAWMIALPTMVYAAESGRQKEQAVDLNRAEQLISLLKERIEADPSIQDSQKRQETYNAHVRRVTSATLELGRMGDAVVDRILREPRNAHVCPWFSGRAISVLRNVGTPKAQKALLGIALDRTVGVPDARTAAYYYVEMMRERNDKGACKVLLDSDDPGVQSEGMRGIDGIPLDPESFKIVRKHLEYKPLYAQSSALSVIQHDPSPNLAEEKVQALVELLNGVKDLPGGDLKVWEFEHGNRGNVADSRYSRYVWVLWQITGSDASLRKQMASAPEGIVRHCLALALAWRDHVEAVRESLQSFLKDTNYRAMTGLRRQCLDAFRTYGQPEDIAFLKELAASDPYNEEVYKGNYSGFLEKWGDEYINLTKEQKEKPEEHFFPKMEKLAGYQIKPAETIYPIRRAAQWAIKAIEDRAAGIKDAGQGALPAIR